MLATFDKFEIELLKVYHDILQNGYFAFRVYIHTNKYMNVHTHKILLNIWFWLFHISAGEDTIGHNINGKKYLYSCYYARLSVFSFAQPLSGSFDYIGHV